MPIADELEEFAAGKAAGSLSSQDLGEQGAPQWAEAGQGQQAANGSSRRVLLAGLAGLCCAVLVAVAAVFVPRSSPVSPPSSNKLDTRTGIEFALIPAGSFQMGSPSSEQGRSFPEGPRHEVRISQAFWMAKHEVTNAQYRRFLAETSHRKPKYWDDAAFIAPDQPVVGVSWDDAVAYCNWAGMQLPSEAQWEYAARAGTTTRYWSGDAEADLARVGWYSENSGIGTQPVGQKPANAWGLYDMHGNVWNWTADRYGAYPASAQTDPKGSPTGDHRVFRGGSWVDLALGARAAIRMWHEPAVRGRVLGFRPVLPAPSISAVAGAATNEARLLTNTTLALDEKGPERAWEGEYRDGEKVGPWMTWHGNGQKAWEGEFKDGELQQSTSWHDNGQKASQFDYQEGQQHGRSTSWHRNGQKARESEYQHGRVGNSLCWNDAGREEPCPH